VWAKLQGTFGYCFADRSSLLVADLKAQRISIVARDGSARVLAEGQERAFYPQLVGERAFWAAFPFVRRPDGTSQQEAHLRTSPRAGGEVVELLSGTEVWDFQPTTRGVYFLARERGGLLRGERCLLRRVDADGRVSELGRADGADALLAWEGGLAWRAGGEVFVADPDGGGRRCLCRVETIRAWSRSPRGLAVILSTDDSNAREVAEIAWDGSLRKRMSFTEQYLNSEIVATASGIYFNLAHEVLRVE
jgi:hypothetical protein